MAKIGTILALAGALLTSCASEGYITAAPQEPYYERPAAPYNGAVWIDGDWAWRGGKYVYTRGYWARPRANRVWVKGDWQSGQRGYTWHRGHWRR